MKLTLVVFLLTCFSYGEIFAQDQERISMPEKSALNFRQNMGQWDNNILYSGIVGDAKVAFLNNAISYNFHRKIDTEAEAGELAEYLVWNINFLNSNANKEIRGLQATNSKTSYFFDKDVSKHVINPKDFNSIVYQNIYSNVDLVYYGTKEGQLKYDYILHPGGSLNSIQMQTDGIESIEINRSGQLEINTPWGTLLEQKPYSYQTIDGIVKVVDVRYEQLADNVFGFKAYGDFDKTKDLIIDPITLEWSTYVGGTTEGLWAYPFDIDVDDKGVSYVTGYVNNKILTTPGVYDESYNGGAYDIFVFKLNATGTDVEYTTYIGGNEPDFGSAIRVNGAGEAYVTGWTQSTNFPTSANALSRTYSGSTASLLRPVGAMPIEFIGGDVVALKLNATGTKLEYSTYLGGSGSEEPGRGALALNNDGEVFIHGFTMSKDFPVTTGAFDETYNGGRSDGFIAKLDPSGSKLVYSTYYGGSKEDNYGTLRGWWYRYDNKELLEFQVPGGLFNYYHSAGKITINDAGEAFAAGWTRSSDFPTTTGAFQRTLNTTDTNNIDATVIRLNANGSGLIYSTLIGGSKGADAATSIVVDKNNWAYICGMTNSSDYPTPNGQDRVNHYQNLSAFYTGQDAFITKIAPDGKSLAYSTFLGGNSDLEVASDIAITENNEVFVTGVSSTSSCPNCRDFPTTTCALQQDNNGKIDVFLTKLNALGRMDYSSLLGGYGFDYMVSMDIMKENCLEEVFLTFSAHSNSPYHSRPGVLPITANAYQKACNTCLKDDIPVVVRVSPEVDVDFEFIAASCGDPTQFTANGTSTCVWKSGVWNPAFWMWDFGDGTTSTEQNPSHQYVNSGTYQVKLKVSCPEDSITKTVVIPNSFNTVDLGPDISTCTENPINQTLDPGAQPAGVTFKWNDGATGQTKIVSQPGKYWVTVSNGSCSATDTVLITQEKMGMSVTSVKPLCFDSKDGTIKAMPAGGTSPYLYKWADGQTTQTAVGLGAGEHTIKVTDKNGCELNATLTLTAPDPIQVSVSPMAAGCSGVDGSASASASGGTGAYTYAWSNGSSGTTVANLSAGNQSVTATDANGCEQVKNFTIEGDVYPILVNLTLKQNADCSGQGGSATVTPNGGDGPYEYKWDDGQTTRTATNLGAGQHTVTVTDISGCAGTLVVDIQSSGDLSTEIKGAVIHGCDRFGAVNAEATVIVSGGQTPYTYLWDDVRAQTTAKADGLSTGTYTVVVKDQGGCSSVATVVINDIIQLDAVVVKYPDCSTCADGEAMVNVGGSGTAPYTYRWTDKDLQTVSTTESATGLMPGIYIVSVTDSNGCRSTDTVDVGNVTGIKDQHALNNMISIYPNPNNGSFNISVETGMLQNIEVRLFEITGRQIMSTQIQSGETKLLTMDLANGIYLIEIKSGAKRITKRIQVVE